MCVCPLGCWRHTTTKLHAGSGGHVSAIRQPLLTPRLFFAPALVAGQLAAFVSRWAESMPDSREAISGTQPYTASTRPWLLSSAAYYYSLLLSFSLPFRNRVG